MDATPAGIYLLVDLSLLWHNGSGCAGYRLSGQESEAALTEHIHCNFNCTTLAVTASSVSVGGQGHDGGRPRAQQCPPSR